ncbi:MAG: TonB-dependent siderophore receptor [Novosphingobium sp. 28-62-57]|uniref:TonB-dependent receptor n=1 Tax=unclassified Novosphingobium TaxID=2644732 RepID=UPI000BC78278|nr:MULTISPECIES: TonB-dependent siderophore receptor [unclassified Novosphingobium]OYW49969.1 MAG: TonB-dependent siderophore receptor [Novosphingobium sp. 12-62-10]OYZ12123.1 MAG: TonB-dependent siderophore receptor [Novosphingobium sp. 28-62-57]OZA31604.1 MAG: TonB-dependent siderophore receptor [Novosphingobium sp. 17-62-9]HQS69516.1 TonB-dependent siderophore receptor [Novosphingobium sp.]
MTPSKTLPSFLALGCVGAMAFTGPAQAQEAEEGQRLGGMTVTDTAIEEPQVKVERAASPKYTAPLLDTPQTITVISAKSIQQQNLLTLRDVLQTVPGITFGAGEGGFGYGDRIILRGQDAKNDVTIDGVRSGSFQNRNETYNIEQIEVANGANSVFNGGGSVAGNINLVTKRPLANDQSLLSAGVGTDNYYRATADINKRLSDLIAVRLNAVYHENDVPGRDVEFFKRWGVAPSIKIGVDGPTSLTLQYEHLDDKSMPQYGLRYYAHLGGFLSDFNRSGYYGFANLDQQNAITNSVQAIFSHELAEGLALRNLTRYEKVAQHTVTSQPTGTFCLASTGLQPGTFAVPSVEAACPATVPVGYYLPTGGRGVQRFINNSTFYDQLDLTANFSTAGIEHNLVIGGSALWEDFDQTSGNLPRNTDGTTPAFALVNIANPGVVVQGPDGFTYGSNVYTGPVNFILGSQNRGKRRAISGYLFDTMKFGDKFEINGGVRYENVTGSNRTVSYATTGATLGQVSGTTGPFEIDNNLFSYRVGAVFKPTPDTSLYIATGTSKNPSQTAVDGSCAADNCNLAPETTTNYEIGAKADLFGKKLLVNLALFRNDRDSIRVPSGDPTIIEQRLDGKQRVQGISFGASGNITENWTIVANYMYLDAKILQGVSDLALAAGTLDPTGGTQLINTPEHSGSLFTTYRFGSGLELGYGLTYQGKFLLNSPTAAQVTAGTYVPYYVPSYTVHRLMVSYPITERLLAQVNVQNFTNAKYVTTVRNQLGGSWAQPAPTRSAVLSLNYSF